MNFTVEATTAPVLNGDWSLLRHVIDVVPGTILIEDADEPVLVVPVQAEEPMKAALFVDGLSKMLGIELRAGSIYPEPLHDFDVDAAEAPGQTPEVVDALTSWANNAPEFGQRLDSSGHLVRVDA